MRDRTKLIGIALISVIIELSFFSFFISNPFLFPMRFVVIIGGSIIIYHLYKKLDHKEILLTRRKQIITLIIITSSILATSGIVYELYFDVTYEISISIEPAFAEKYTLILPAPADEDYSPNYEDRYPWYCRIVQTEYGKGLEISSDNDVLFNFKGRGGKNELSYFSMPKSPNDQRDQKYWINVNSTTSVNWFRIDIHFKIDSLDSEYHGRVLINTEGQGWDTVWGTVHRTHFD